MAADWETISPKGGSDGWETIKPSGANAYGAADAIPAVPMGETALSLGTGTLGAIAGGLAGLGQGALNVLGSGLATPREGMPAGDRVRQVQEALTYQPRTKSGQKMTEAVVYPFEKFGELAHEAGARVSDASGSPLLGTAANTVIQAVPNIVGKGVSKVARATVPPEKPGMRAAADAGYSFMPDEAGAGPISRTAANLAGEPKLAKAVSKKNQPIHNEKAIADLGLPEGTILDLDTVRGVRKQAGAAYEEMRGTGTVTPSAAYGADLDALVAKYANVSKDFPDMARADLQAVVDAARRPTFRADSAVDLISQLRASADEAFAGRKTGLGKVQRGVADAIEAELGRHLEAQAAGALAAGDTAGAAALSSLLERYQGARTRIAKAYLAEKALGGGVEINPQVYGAALAKGKPLSGKALEIAEFARRFPRSSMRTAGAPSAGGPTIMDAGMAMLGSDNARQGAGLMFARPVARAVLASGPYQAGFIRNAGALHRGLASPEAAAALGLVPAIGIAQPPQERRR